MNLWILLIYSTSLIIFAPMALATKFNVNSKKSGIHFSVNFFHYLPIYGNFSHFNGSFEYSQKSNTLKNVSIKIAANSIDTGNYYRNRHLKHEGFFQVDEHPYITYRSKKVERLSQNEFQILGLMRIKNVEKEVPAKIHIVEKSNNSMVASFRFSIDRKEFALNPPKEKEESDVLIGKEVKIHGVMSSHVSP